MPNHDLLAEPEMPAQRALAAVKDAPGATELRQAQRLRVLIVNSTLHIGGAEQVAANLATQLDRDRFDVTACFLKENGIVGAQMQREGVDLVPIPGHRKGRDYLTSLKLRRLIRDRGIQLIHTHDLHGFMDGAICRLTIPGLRHVHTFHFGNYPNVLPRYARLEKLLWRIPDALIAVGHEQASSIRALYDIPENRLRIVWNGVAAVDPEVGAEVSAVLPGGDIPVIASISTLIPQKGLGDLLRAAALLKQWGRQFLLLIAGEGKLKAELQSQAAELGLTEHTRFLGWVREASRRALPACDIFVQSSHWEAMSVVIIEAMAAGKAIVATTVGENGRVLTGSTAILVPPRNPEALARGLAQMLDDADLRRKLGRAARQRYEEQLTIAHMIRKHESLYEELVVSNKRDFAHGTSK